MSAVAGLLHDPATGTSRRVQVACEGDALHVSGASVDRRVPAAALSVARGGWDGRQIHLAWSDEGRTPSVSIDLDGARTLAACMPAALAAELGRLAEAGERQARRGRRTLPLLLLIFVVLPLTLLAVLLLMRDRIVDAVVRRLPTTVDAQVGLQLHGQLAGTGRLLTEGPAVDAVRAIGGRLVTTTPQPDFSFRFEVLRDPSVNAFAAPGGLVVVHTGLLAATETPEELAGVLAHEAAHVLERHSMRQVVFQLGLTGALQLLVGSPEGAAGALTGAASNLTALRFSRDQERDADRRGLDLLQRARLPASGFVRFFGTLEKAGTAPPALLSSHPPSADRAAALRAEMQNRGDWPVDPIAVDWESVRRAAR